MHTQKTIEGQQSALNSSSNRSMMVVADELASFLGGMAAYKGGGAGSGAAAAEAAVYLSMHSSGFVPTGTKGGGGGALLQGTYCFGLLAGTQPNPYRQALLNTHAIQTGMSARVMACVNNTLPAIRGAFCSLQCALA